MKFFKSHRRLFIFLIIGLLILFIVSKLLNKNSSNAQYQTSPVELGTLVTSISGSGTITSGNYTNISTKVSGVVNQVFVTNGDTVTKGQKIATVTLDDYAMERQTGAWVAYLDATVAVKEAINGKDVSDIAMWQARQTVLDAQKAYDEMNNSAHTDNEKMIIVKTLDQSRKAFSVYEAKYLNYEANISNARAKVASALRTYNENSSTIVSPSDGVISDLALAKGVLVNASSTTSSTSGATIVSAQTVGKISHPSGQLVATVSLTEIDIVKVKANQKVSLTLDSYPDKTFTGKVLAVNTSGSISSGVTSYPVTILLDPVTVDIYPNMAVSVQIITSVKSDVLLIPSSAVQTLNGESSVQILKNGQVSAVTVEIGSSNDSQTEIISGLKENDLVVTSTISADPTSQSSATSPFSGINSSGRNSGNFRIGGPAGGF